MRILVTAGPTREPLDPVRYLSNRSSGAMGFALAQAALDRGHEVLLVLGPVEDQPPVGAEVYGVETALEMHEAALDFLAEADAVFCAAAVCDFRPRERSAAKIKRTGALTLELVENPDVAAALGARRGDRPCVIFALETERGVEHAREKLMRKRATLCVLNGPEAIGAERARFTLVVPDAVRELGELSKAELARTLLDELKP